VDWVPLTLTEKASRLQPGRSTRCVPVQVALSPSEVATQSALASLPASVLDRHDVIRMGLKIA
jgi:hypothetical protein